MDRDVTARKQAERRSATQAAVSKVLSERSSLADAAVPILSAIGTSEGWDVGTIWTRQRDGQLGLLGQWSRLPAGEDQLGAATRRYSPRRDQGLVGAAWSSGRTLLVPDLAGETRYQRSAAALADGLRSVVVVPVTNGDEVLGVLEFASRSIHEPEPGLSVMFETIGRQLGQFAERRRAEEAVQRFFAGSPAVIYALRVGEDALTLAWFGGNIEAVCGWPAERVDGTWWENNIHPEDRERILAASATPYTHEHQVLEFRFRRPDGSWVWIRDEKRLLRDADGRATEVVGSWTDVTARVELEAQFRVSQKLEAVGLLAGGVAHDFNNMLTVISGNSEMLAQSLPEGSGERALVGEILGVSERAASLTRQLLAFGRSQVLAPRRIELNAAVESIEPMLRRLIGEDVKLSCDLSRETGFVRVDLGQLEQVIVNLALNARDAMPHGGTLCLSTRAVAFEADDAARPADAAPGSYAEIVVSDTGSGIPPHVLPRIFEPFFTTKGAGKGSGLGLSTVFGIVKQSGGHIRVDSEEARGTTFRIALPRLDPTPSAESAPPPTDSAIRSAAGKERILLVEDQEGVRKVTRLALESRGFTVFAAPDGRAAIELFETSTPPIDLLLTDLVMPDLSGRQLAEILRARRPGLPVLFMSGYVGDELERHGLVDPESFLHKPFSLQKLIAKVRAALDGGAAGL
jgi:PAS domain S-box-containing protein